MTDYAGPPLQPSEDDYLNRLYDFVQANGGALQPQDLSDMAANLAISSIAQYPYSGSHPDILADKMMRHYITDLGAVGQVGISEFANMIPDPALSARKVNDVHEAFGIPYNVTEQQAVSFAYRATYEALEGIQQQTLLEASRIAHEIPQELVDPVADLDNGDAAGPWAFDRDVAHSLDEYLGSDAEVQALVSAHFGQLAAGLHANTVRQRQYAQKVILPQNLQRRKNAGQF